MDQSTARLRDVTNVQKWFKNYNTIEITRKGANVTEAVQKGILKELKVRDGDIWNASNEQLLKYISYLSKVGAKPKTFSDWVHDLEKLDLLSTKESNRIANLLKTGLLPVDLVISKIF